MQCSTSRPGQGGEARHEAGGGDGGEIDHPQGEGGEVADGQDLGCTVLYCTVLYCTVLYCTVLYCTVLYCIVNPNQSVKVDYLSEWPTYE